MTPQAEEPWTVWLAVRGVFELARANFVTFFIVSFALSLPVTIVQMIPAIDAASSIVGVICSIFLAIAFAYGALQAMNGVTPDAASMLQQIGRLSGTSLLRLGFAQNVAVILAFLAFILPGLYLIARWMVAIPVMMAEKTDVGTAFRRSSELTLGRRSSVLAVFLTCLAAFILANAIVFVPLFLVLDIEIDSKAFQIASSVIASLFASALYCVPPVLYLFLRHEKEGTAIEDIVETLD